MEDKLYELRKEIYSLENSEVAIELIEEIIEELENN